MQGDSTLLKSVFEALSGIFEPNVRSSSIFIGKAVFTAERGNSVSPEIMKFPSFIQGKGTT
jgi:hypothetical protein